MQVKQQRPNILMIVMDSVRAANVSCYGYARPTTPSLDALAAAGTRFDQAVSTGCWTLPVHASLFTGLYQSAHGVHISSDALAPDVPTLAEILRDEGYATGCLSNNPYISPATGLARGFDLAEELWRGTHRRIRRSRLSRLARWLDARGGWARPLSGGLAQLRTWRSRLRRWRNERDGGAALTNSRAQGWIEQQRAAGKPFFLFINYMECHEPYQPPSPFRQKFLPRNCSRWHVAAVSQQKRVDAESNGKSSHDELEILRGLYDGAVNYLDSKIGELTSFLKARGLLDDTAVIVTSDHGDSLGEHGQIGHRLELYEPLVRVPLVIRYPGRLAAGVTHTDPVELRDLFPTALELAGADCHEPADDTGYRAVSLLHPQSADDRPWTFAENKAPQSHGGVVARMIRSRRQKLIWRSDGRHELYDLERDPGEVQNMIEQEPELACDLEGELQRWQDALTGEAVGAGVAEYGEHVLSRLRDLGYIE